MFVRTPNSNLSRPIRRKRKPLWDGLTIGLAIAVVLLGFLIFFAPKSAPPSRTPTKYAPANMAEVTSPAAEIHTSA